MPRPSRFRTLLLTAGTCAVWLPVQAQNAPADADNAHYKQAQQDLDGGDANAAADEYEAALAADPKLADAHYELGVLYAEKLSEPIAALYHLDRFLKLAPNSPNAPAARDLVTTESEAFAASLPGTSTSTALARLELENAELKKQAADAAHTIVQLQGQLAQNQAQLAQAGEHPAPASPTAPEPAAGAPMAQNTISPAPVIAPPTPGAVVPSADASAGPPDTTTARSYTVVKHDTLWTIAKRMYPGHTKEGVDKIQEANKDELGNKPLKIGQVLVIPQLD